MECDGNLHGLRIKNSSVKKYQWEQNFSNLEELGQKEFWIRLVVFCEFEFGQIVEFVAKNLCTIFD